MLVRLQASHFVGRQLRVEPINILGDARGAGALGQRHEPLFAATSAPAPGPGSWPTYPLAPAARRRAAGLRGNVTACGPRVRLPLACAEIAVFPLPAAFGL